MQVSFQCNFLFLINAFIIISSVVGAATPTRNPTLKPSAAPTRVAPPIPPSTLTASSGIQPLYDGETGSYPATGVFSYATSVGGKGEGGTVGLVLAPDPWHAPAFVLPAPVWRSALAKYSSIEFYVSCANPNTPLTIKFTSYARGSSNTLAVGSYAVPVTETTVGTSWTFVSIPISAFATSTWDLTGVENIYFNSDSSSRQCTIDNMYLLYTAPTAAPSTPPTLSPTPQPSTTAPTRAAVDAPPLVLIAGNGVQPVFDGQSGSYPGSGLSWAAAVAGAGEGGRVGLVLSPDPWHSPSINLPAPLWRSQLGTQYTHLTFYVSCANSATPISLSIGGYQKPGSNSVYLGSYAVPLDTPPTTTIGKVWTLVRIPMSALVNTAWDLSGAETIYFNKDSQYRQCTIDSMYFEYPASLPPTAAPSKTPSAVPSATPTRAPSAFPTRAAVPVPPINLVASPGVQPIYDGEAGSYSISTPFYAANVAGAGEGGSVGLVLSPDNWHAPGFTLPAPAYRYSNFASLYTYLSLYVSCAQPGTPLTLHFARWVADATIASPSSGTVSLGSYAMPQDGSNDPKIGTEWTFVRVPIAAFLTSSWDFSGVETIYFNSDSKNRQCTVDNVYLEYDPTSPPTAVPTASPTTSSPTTASPTRESVALPDLRMHKVLGVVPLYDGELNSFSSTDIRYAASVPGVGLGGSHGLALYPDPWHAPAFLLQDPLYRSDVSVYNELVLYARCDAENIPLSMHFGRWVPPNSNLVPHSESVYLGAYSEPLDSPPGITIGTQWTKVRIPIPAFFTPGWHLAGAEWIYFNSDVKSRRCYVDNFLARENVGPHVIDVKKLSDTVLQVRTNKYYDLVSARQLNNYQLQLVSSTGEVLSTDTPTSTGLQYRFTGYKDGSMVPAANYSINILFSNKIDCANMVALGASYVLHVANVRDPAENLMIPANWTLDCPAILTTTSIKINQLGYLPNHPKLAYIGEYYGDMQGAVWAVGAGASIWYYTRVRGEFTRIPDDALPVGLSRSVSLRAVAAVSPTDVWVVGDAGTILHFDGSAWMLIPANTNADLLAIDFSPDRTYALAVGTQGTVLKFNPNANDPSGDWAVLTVPSAGTAFDYHTVFAGATEIWVGGSEGALLYATPTTTTTATSRTTKIGKLTLRSTPTNQTIFTIEGVRQDSASSFITSSGLKFWNRYGTWLLDHDLGFEIKDFVLNRQFSKSGVGVGLGGLVTTMTSDITPVYFLNASIANDDLNTVAMLDAYTVFAFGVNGACVTGSSLDINVPWTKCSLPGPAADVFGATSLSEGPLRLPWPRPAAQLQQQQALADGELTWVTVGTFPVVLRIANYHLSGEDLYTVDFSTATSIGTHRLLVDGIGSSHVFQISSDALASAGYHTCRMLYYQRSGMPNGIQTPYAEPRFARPIDHEFDLAPGGRKIDGAYHWSIANSTLYAQETICPLKTADCSPDSYRDGAGGWFDAGDYSKYMSTAAPSVWRLMTSVEILASRSLTPTDSLNIPESGDGVPDMLNEATWELLWMLKMQREDGGAYNKLASEHWEFREPSSLELGGQFVRFFLYRTTHDSATAGAAFALASRMWAPYDATLSALFLQRARLAWDFLQVHSTASPEGGFVNPPGHVSGPYPDIDDTDNRAWLAAELYRTTCDSVYGDSYVAYIAAQNNIVALGGNDFVDFRLEALWAFYYSGTTCASSSTSEPSSYATVRALIYSALKRSVDGSKSMAVKNPYRNVGRLDVPEWIGWGSSGAVNWGHFMGILGWHMFNDRSQLDWVVQSLDVVLGANPIATSYITGLGHTYPMDPTQGQSRTDDVVEPLPGYAVMGPYGHVSLSSPYFRVAQGDDANYPSLLQLPSPFPVLRRWSDANELPQYNEGGVGPLTYLCGVYQVLHADAQSSSA